MKTKYPDEEVSGLVKDTVSSQVKGAVLVDTTNLSIKQVEDKLTKLVKKAVNNKYGNL